jgi:hypothetical protein
MKAIVSLLVLFSFTPAFAEADKHPCHAIHEACEKAGFVKGGHKDGGKGLFVDCLAKIKKGESVPGVTVKPEDIQACKDKREEKREEKAKKS